MWVGGAAGFVPGQPEETLGGLVLLALQLVDDELLESGRLAGGGIEALLDFLRCENYC